jgi:hypothetical protein
VRRRLLLCGIIRYFDRFLRWAYGVFEFCNDPNCLLRVRVTRTARPVSLPGGQVPAGAPVLELHLWNEHLPPIPAEGPDIAWGVRTQRLWLASLRALARQIRQDPRLAGVQVVAGITSVFAPGDGGGGEKHFVHLGFTVLPHHSPLGRFGEFWENLYAWGIMWGFNAATLRHRRLLRLRRTEVWMMAEEFLRRYGSE